MDTFVLLYRLLLDHFGADINYILYLLGKTQVMGIVDVQRKLFGVRKDQELLNNITQQAELIGMGNLKVKDFEKKGLLVVNNLNSQFCRRYIELLGHHNDTINYFLTGCLTGLAQSLCNKNMVGIETTCIMQKKPFCCIEIKDKDGWDLNVDFIKNHFPKTIIDKNMLERHLNITSFFAPM